MYATTNDIFSDVMIGIMALKTGSYVLGIDLGGTKILAAVVDKKGRILGEGKRTTQGDRGPDHVIGRIVKACDEALENAKLDKLAISAFGIGVPGIVDDHTGIALTLTNVQGFENIPLAKKLRAWLDVPVTLQNDVKAATRGEMMLGAGKGLSDVIVIFVGTGIGGGIVMGGKILLGAHGAGGEVGHMVVLPDGPYTSAPQAVRGSIETLSSRGAIVRDLRIAIANERKSLIPALAEERGGDITSAVLADAIKREDELTTEVVTKAARYLGIHAASLINALDPEMIIYGGGVVEALGDFMLPLIQHEAMIYSVYRAGAEKIRIVKSELGDHAGVLGAAMGAFEKIVGSP